MRSITKGVLLIIFTSLIITVIVSASLGIDIPTRYNFNARYGEHMKMATYNLATFESIEREIMIMKEWIIVEFPENRENTYNSAFYWDFVYNHSVQANVDYLDSLLERINDYKQMQRNMVINTDGVQFRDWYDQAIQNLRSEMSIKDRDGNPITSKLDFIVFNAWVLKYHQEAYWLIYYTIPIILALITMLIITCCLDMCKSDEEYKQRLRQKEEELNRPHNGKQYSRLR